MDDLKKTADVYNGRRSGAVFELPPSSLRARLLQ